MCSALVPAALGGVAWSSRRTAATPGLLVIARADDVDDVAVTGIKDRADSSITQDDMPKCSQLLAPSHGENRGSSPLGSANKINNLDQSRAGPTNNRPTIERLGLAVTPDACARFVLSSSGTKIRLPRRRRGSGSKKFPRDRLGRSCAEESKVMTAISEAERARRQSELEQRRLAEASECASLRAELEALLVELTERWYAELTAIGEALAEIGRASCRERV